MAQTNKYRIALEVWQGKWGVVPERYKKLEKAGYNAREIQDLVEKYSPSKLKQLADEFDKANYQEPEGDALEVKVNLSKYKKILLIFEE